jgi:hypothetical protein
LFRGDIGVYQRRYPARPRDRLDENVLALAVELRGQQANSGRVPARSRERFHQPIRYHVVGHADERYRPGRRLKDAQLGFGAADNRIGRGVDHGLCPFGEQIDLSVKAARNDREVLTLDESIETQLVEEG